jgi:hypothetical protein
MDNYSLTTPIKGGKKAISTHFIMWQTFLVGMDISGGMNILGRTNILD